MDCGFFGELFDLDGDGKLDSFEQAAGLATIVKIMNEIEAEDAKLMNKTDERDDDEELDDEFDFMGTGYSVEELELMDEDERAEIFADAGLDPDDFDF